MKTLILKTTIGTEGFQIADHAHAWPDFWRSFGFWDGCETRLIEFGGRFYLESGALACEVPPSSMIREILDEGRLGEWRTIAELADECRRIVKQ